MLDRNGQMLVTAKVDRLHATQGAQGFVAALLRPPVAIEVRQQTAILTAVHVDRPTESRSGQDGLVTDAHPVLGPRSEELQLAIAEKLQAGQIDALRIILLVGDVIGARALRRNLAHGGGLELTILEDGKIHAADLEAGVEDADAPLDRSRIKRIRQMPRLLTLDHVHIGDRIEVAAVSHAGDGGQLTTLAPEVGVADVMVVRNTNRRAILHHVTELQTELDPTRGVLGVAIGLVTREE